MRLELPYPPSVNAFLQQRYEAIGVVLNRPRLSFCKIPLRVKSSANGSRGISMRALRGQAMTKKTHREAGLDAGERFRPWMSNAAGFFVVRIVRIAPRALDDDNLAACLKAIRDGVAKAIGVNDRDPRVRYVADQWRGKPRESLIQIELYASVEPRPVNLDFREINGALKRSYGRKELAAMPTANVVRKR
jgi:hypothetical protein